MRQWTIPILGAVALSIGQPPAAATAQPAASSQGARAEAVFWPSAADDLVGYAFFPRGTNDRFWAFGYGAILRGAFADSDAADVRRGRRIAGKAGSAADLSGDLCGSGRVSDGTDRLIERIEQAIEPNASQRDVLVELRTALAQTVDRIKSACPAATPTTTTERLKAIQDRIWAMRDALLTLRLPLERFHGSLNDEQRWRLHRADPDAETAATTGSGGARTENCGERAASIADWPMRAIERAVRPTEQQRATLEMLRMRLAAMAPLIASSCPTYPLLGPSGRIAAAADRLDVMLFTVMTLSPALPDFHDSLSDKQKAALSRAIRQFGRGQASDTL
jgi:LTXXQ motif family protein